jgi:hypothetical protein
MASLGKIGKSAGLMFGAAAVFGAARGVAESDPLAYGINAGFDAFLGSPDIDNTILGTDLTAGNLVGRPLGMDTEAGSSAVGGAAGGALIGGGMGLVAGRSKVGRIVGGTIGAGIGAGIGAVAGGVAGLLNSTEGRVLFPRDNPADMFSSRSINKTPYKLLSVDEDKINKPYINQAKYNSDIKNQYSNMPGSIYPQRLSSRQWDSATGDVVLGSYNLRHG